MKLIRLTGNAVAVNLAYEVVSGIKAALKEAEKRNETKVGDNYELNLGQ